MAQTPHITRDQFNSVAQWLQFRTGDLGVLGSNPAGGTSLRNFGNSVYRTLPGVTECLSEETIKAVGPFYLVSMPVEVKYPTQEGKCVTCHELQNSEINHSCVCPRIGCLEYT